MRMCVLRVFDRLLMITCQNQASAQKLNRKSKGLNDVFSLSHFIHSSPLFLVFFPSLLHLQFVSISFSFQFGYCAFWLMFLTKNFVYNNADDPLSLSLSFPSKPWLNTDYFFLIGLIHNKIPPISCPDDIIIKLAINIMLGQYGRGLFLESSD